MNDNSGKLPMLNYSPHYLTSTPAVIEAHSLSLKNLLGSTLLESWAVWDLNQNEWFNDAPVVLNFEGVYLELNFFKLNELSITFNTLDLSESFNWGGLTMFELIWRRDALSELNAAKSHRLEKIEIVDVPLETEVVMDRNNPSEAGRKEVDWLLGGINFWMSDGKFFSVFNGLDENAVTSKFPDDETRYRSVEII